MNFLRRWLIRCRVRREMRRDYRKIGDKIVSMRVTPVPGVPKSRDVTLRMYNGEERTVRVIFTNPAGAEFHEYHPKT